MSQHKILQGSFAFPSDPTNQPGDLEHQFDLLFKQLSQQFAAALTHQMASHPPADGADSLRDGNVGNGNGSGNPPVSDVDTNNLPFAVVLTLQERSGETPIGRIQKKLEAFFWQLVGAAKGAGGYVGAAATLIEALKELLKGNPTSPEAHDIKALAENEQGLIASPEILKLLRYWESKDKFRALSFGHMTEQSWLDFLKSLRQKLDELAEQAAGHGAGEGAAVQGPAVGQGAAAQGAAGQGAQQGAKQPPPQFQLTQLMGWLTKVTAADKTTYGFRVEGMTRFPDNAVEYGTWARLDVFGPDGSQLLTRYVDYKTLEQWLIGDGDNNLNVAIEPTNELRAALESKIGASPSVTHVSGRLWFSDGQPFGVRTIAVFVPPRFARPVNDCCAPEGLNLDKERDDCCDDCETETSDLVLTPQALGVTQTDQAGYFEFTYRNDARSVALTQRYAMLQVSGLATPLALELIRDKQSLVNKDSEPEKFGFPAPVLLQVDSALIQPVSERQTIDWTGKDDDCDCRGIDFDEPNRAIEEFKMDIVIRTTDPMIVRSRLDLRDDTDQPGDANKGDFALENWDDAGARGTIPAGSPVNALFRTPLSRIDQIQWDDAPLVAQAVTISHGRVLTISQVWRADGYSLGDLCYSLPLAPLQKKNIAVIDWGRRDTLQMESNLRYQESLQNYVGRQRDISEIVNSALNEAINAHSESGGNSSSGGFGVSLGPIGFGSGSGGSSMAYSRSGQNSNRTLASNFINQLRDQTVQSANALRAQRVTTVQQVNQSESAQAVTETVANRNACHAITVQYFEVLRHFRIDHELAAVRECLYIPLPISAFDKAKVLRWRWPLEQYLPSLELRDAVDACQRLEEDAYSPEVYADEEIQSLSGEIELILDFPLPPTKLDAATDWKSYLGFDFPSPSPLPSLVEQLKGLKDDQRSVFFEQNVAPVLARKLVANLECFANSPTGNALLPLEPSLGSAYRAGEVHKVTFRERGDVASMQIIRRNLGMIILKCKVPMPDFDGVILSGAAFTVTTAHLQSEIVPGASIQDFIIGSNPITISTQLRPAELRNRKSDDQQKAALLLKHLNSNVEYYHKAIWWTMDPDRRFALLDGYIAPNAGGRSVASVVENRLAAIIGNSLVMPVAPGIRLDYFADTAEVKDGHDSDSDGLLAYYRPLIPSPSTRIAVPTRGVFAESVMGKCNSCEKIDNGRNWQYWQHPLPDEPTQIEPVSLGTRVQDTPVAPTPQMPPAIVNQVATSVPPAPDPTGLASAIAAITNGNAFRDGTGLAGTQQNARDALSQTFGATTQFGNAAAELSKKQIDAAMEAMKMVASLYTGVPMLDGASKVKDSISKDAAAGRITTPQAQESIHRLNSAMIDSLVKSPSKSLIDHPEVSSAIGAAAIRGAPLTLSKGDMQVDVGRSLTESLPNTRLRLPWPFRLLSSPSRKPTPTASSTARFDFAALSQAYPQERNRAKFFEYLGGMWPSLVDDPNYKNTCAIRMSVALKRVGVKIPKSFREGMEGDGSPLIIKVSTMDSFITQLLGAPSWSRSKKRGEEIAPPSQTGIITYRENWGLATGHFDLWTGTDFVGPAGNFSDMTDSHYVALWAFS